MSTTSSTSSSIPAEFLLTPHNEFREYKLLRYIFSHPHAQWQPLIVLELIDKFAKEEAWMMNIGPDKGKVLQKQVENAKDAQVIVEVGTYVGYSAILIASHMSPHAHLYCIEIDVLLAAIANTIIEYAGLSSRVTVIVGTVETHLLSRIKNNTFNKNTNHANNNNNNNNKPINKIDLLFLDHNKDLYLSDFKYIEQSGLIGSSSIIVADNIIFPGVPEYATYIRENKNYRTTFFEGTLEYRPDIKDGVEVSVRL